MEKNVFCYEFYIISKKTLTHETTIYTINGIFVVALYLA